MEKGFSLDKPEAQGSSTANALQLKLLEKNGIHYVPDADE